MKNTAMFMIDVNLSIILSIIWLQKSYMTNGFVPYNSQS